MKTMNQFLEKALSEVHKPKTKEFDFPTIKTKVKDMKGDKSKIKMFKKEVMNNPGFKQLEKKSKDFLMGLFDNALKESTEISEASANKNEKLMEKIRDILAKAGMNAAKLDPKKGGMDKNAKKNIQDSISDAIEIINDQIGI